MKKTIEELLDMEYWIIDILPKQVPKDSPGQYFAVEAYLRKTRLAQVKEKHVNLILKLNCYRDISLDEEGLPNPSPEETAAAVRERYVNILVDEALIVSEPEDTYLTVFHPDGELLELLKELAAGEGMFVWQP